MIHAAGTPWILKKIKALGRGEVELKGLSLVLRFAITVTYPQIVDFKNGSLSTES